MKNIKGFKDFQKINEISSSYIDDKLSTSKNIVNSYMIRYPSDDGTTYISDDGSAGVYPDDDDVVGVLRPDAPELDEIRKQFKSAFKYLSDNGYEMASNDWCWSSDVDSFFSDMHVYKILDGSEYNRKQQQIYNLEDYSNEIRSLEEEDTIRKKDIENRFPEEIAKKIYNNPKIDTSSVESWEDLWDGEN